MYKIISGATLHIKGYHKKLSHCELSANHIKSYY